MKGTLRLASGLLALNLLLVLPAASQPPGMGGGGMMGPRGMMPAQLLGFVAFDEETARYDDQLVKLRTALKETHKKQQDMMEEMFSGEVDFQEVRQQMRQRMMELSKETREKAAGVLDEEQVERLKAHMDEMQSRMRPGGGRRQGGGEREAQ